MTVNNWLCVSALWTAAVAGTAFANDAWAQVIPDNTLGAENSVVTPLDLTTQRIDGGALRGSHLFHSFLEFGIPEDTGVYFADPDSISTIFSRVTGENPSEIYGTLGVFGDANLFLLNPSGILFGPNAELDMEGSFVGSTADSLMLPDGTGFSATNPAVLPMLDIQVEAPVGLLFEGAEPGVIVNAANLAVGENLLLAGGTAVSPGELTALTGEVAVVTAVGDGTPGQVELSQAGELVGVDSEPVGAIAPPEQLLVPQWSALAELTVEDGQLQVSDSELAVATGDVVVRQVTADTATLSAAHNLPLVESQLVTQGNLELLAQDTVQVRDSDVSPVIIAAAGDLLVQGNESVDIFALNHSNSGLASGGDMVLRSADAVGGDAHYWTGGNFRIEQLDGELGNLFSPYDPIIRSQGDVSFFGYQGASLHILSGGAVTINVIGITGPDTTDNSINPLMTPNLANVALSDNTQVVIDGSAEPTLDIRAGVDLSIIKESSETSMFPPNVFFDSFFTFTTPPPPNSIATNAAINIGNVLNRGGTVFLSNQYEPNPSLDGDINIRFIDVRSPTGGGNVLADSRNDISLDVGIDVSGENPNNGLILDDSGNIKLIARDNIAFGPGARIFSFGLIGGQTELASNGNIILQDSSINTVNSSNGNGAGGDISLSGKIIDIIGNSFLITSTEGNVNSGRIFVRASESFNIDADGDIAIVGTQVLPNSSGEGGNILIESPQVRITDGAQIISATVGPGRAGNVTLQAGLVEVTGTGRTAIGNTFPSKILSESRGPGNTGDVVIDTQILRISGGAGVSANTEGSGSAGNIFIDASDLVEVTGSPIGQGGIAAQTEGVGQGGDISINTRNLLVANGGAISSGTFRPLNINNEEVSITGDGGDIQIRATESIQLVGNAVSFTGIDSQSNFGTTGSPGNIKILTDNLSIINGARISNSNFGNGSSSSSKLIIDATGSILLNGVADEISGLSPSAILSETKGPSRGGDLILSAQDLLVQDGGQISVSTLGPGEAGTLNIDVQTIELTGVSSLVDESLLIGPSSLLASTSSESTGNGNALTIQAEKLSIEDGARIAVDSQGEGVAGDILIQARALTLNEQGLISAETASNNGGNITIRQNDLLLLRNNSNISTNAGRSLGFGNGGNIDITANFIIAVPEENSDITANASEGNGGNVTINTQGLFGIEFRDKRTPLSDITASSEFGLDGNVNVDTLETDPTSTLQSLPEETANTRIQESCQADNGQAAVSFFDVGRSGAPVTPEDLLGTNSITENWTSLGGETSSELDESDVASFTQVKPSASWTYATSSEEAELPLIVSCHHQ